MGRNGEQERLKDCAKHGRYSPLTPPTRFSIHFKYGLAQFALPCKYDNAENNRFELGASFVEVVEEKMVRWCDNPVFHPLLCSF